MEIQKEVFPAAKQRTARGAKRSKFVGVRQRPSGKWVAEIKNTTQKIRMWLGTFHTAEEAARAYDEAAFLLRGSNTRTNFVNHGPVNSALSSKIRNLLNQKKASRKQSLCLTPATTIAETRTEVRNGESGVTHFDGLKKEDEQVVFGDGYKPDLSKCNGGLEMMGFSQFDQGVVGNEGYGLEGVLCKQDDFEFERMKVERQISSSLYAMNGVTEYWDIVDDSNDVFWDLPMLSQMFCQS